jgi:hypothetical protein
MDVTNRQPSRIFRISTTVRRTAAVVALVTVTITGAGAIVVSGPARTPFTAAKCPRCGTLVMAIPGTPRHVEVRPVARGQDWGACEGRVVWCPGAHRGRQAGPSCDSLLEVIETDDAA